MATCHLQISTVEDNENLLLVLKGRPREFRDPSGPTAELMLVKYEGEKTVIPILNQTPDLDVDGMTTLK